MTCLTNGIEEVLLDRELGNRRRRQWRSVCVEEVFATSSFPLRQSASTQSRQFIRIRQVPNMVPGTETGQRLAGDHTIHTQTGSDGHC